MRDRRSLSAEEGERIKHGEILVFNSTGNISLSKIVLFYRSSRIHIMGMDSLVGARG
jgi:hypothetical protein